MTHFIRESCERPKIGLRSASRAALKLIRSISGIPDVEVVFISDAGLRTDRAWLPERMAHPFMQRSANRAETLTRCAERMILEATVIERSPNPSLPGDPSTQRPLVDAGGLSTGNRFATVMNCIAYRAGKRFRSITLDEIGEVLKLEGAFVWLGLRELDNDLLARIQQEFGLHELAVEDTRSAHQRPKVEEYGDCLFVVLHTAQLVDERVRFGETHLFVGKRFLVSIRHRSTLSYSKVRERCETVPQRLARGPGFGLYALMDFIVDNYRPVVDGLHQRFQVLEADIFKSRFSRETLEQLYELKGELLLLREATEPLMDVCNELMHVHADFIPKDIRIYFRDISDHVKRIN